MRSKYIKLNKKSIIRCIILSMITSVIFSLVSFGFVKLVQRLLIPVFAGSDTKVEEVVVIEERTNIIEVETVKEVNKDAVSMREIGSFNLTSYCPCSICCDQYAASPIGKTGAMGVGVYRGITFAVDPKVIPYGTKMYVEGVGVGIATDCGGAIKGNRIDVYIPDHQEAREFGRQNNKKVYIIE